MQQNVAKEGMQYQGDLREFARDARGMLGGANVAGDANPLPKLASVLAVVIQAEYRAILRFAQTNPHTPPFSPTALPRVDAAMHASIADKCLVEAIRAVGADRHANVGTYIACMTRARMHLEAAVNTWAFEDAKRYEMAARMMLAGVNR